MSSLSTMTQALTPEIMFLYQARPKWRGAAELAPAIMEHINAIRTEIKSGEDSSGWGSVGGWRAGQARPGFSKAAPTDTFRGNNGGRGGGGFTNRGGGGGGSDDWQGKRRMESFGGRNAAFSKAGNDMPKFRRDDPEPTSVPLQSSRTVQSPAAVRAVNTPFNDAPKTNAWSHGAPKADMTVKVLTGTKPKSATQNDIHPPNKGVKTSEPRTYVPYKSMFTNSEQTVENAVVNTIIQDKLNKLSVSNYEDVRDFLFEILDAGETEDFLSDFMKLIFHKAADSIGLSYCPLYARLLHELSAKYGFIQTEINAIYGRFLLVFNEVSDAGNENMEAFHQRNKEKKYRIGYSQFITELLKYDGIIGDADYINTVATITEQMSKLVLYEDKKAVVEEYADCLAKMVKILHTAPKACERLVPKIIARCEEMLKEMSTLSADKPGLSNKARFAMMSIRDNLSSAGH
jgi:hypothetical protein